MQLGGGVTLQNAAEYLDAGASHVIVTSYVFRDGKLDQKRLEELVSFLETQGQSQLSVCSLNKVCNPSACSISSHAVLGKRGSNL